MLLTILSIGVIFTITGSYLNGLYDLFFSICLGLFIGGIIMSIISTFLAEISTHDLQGTDHIDHIDHTDLGHVDHVDYIDHADLGHVDHVDHIDHADLGHVDHVDYIDHADLGHVDHVDYIDHADLGHVDHIDHTDLGHIDHLDHSDLSHIDHVDHAEHPDDTGDSNVVNDTTPAPFMLLFSTSLLLFGISGILFYYLFNNNAKFLIFFTALGVTYLTTKLISTTWKRIAKSRFYNISSTLNLIGQKGVIVLDVDKRGGVMKIKSNNPMKFERVHVKPLYVDSSFEKGEEVYICDIKNGFLLVDKKLSSIRNMTR
ncbi:MAG: NfeD family protein [Promethearchaeota archaeon]